MMFPAKLEVNEDTKNRLTRNHDNAATPDGY